MTTQKKSTFSKKHYNSGMGMLTSVWGPSMWLTLHTISFNYPVKPSKQQQQDYYNYFLLVGKILPCGYCRKNYQKNLKSTNFSKNVFKDRNSLSRWVYKLHNHINMMLGKPKYLTYNAIRDRYENFRAHCRVTQGATKKTTKKDKKEKGCVEPLHGVKSKCVLKIVPKNKKCPTFFMDPVCCLKKH